MIKLTPGEIELLEWAVEEAAKCVGGYDPLDMDAMQANVDDCRRIVAKLKEEK